MTKRKPGKPKKPLLDQAILVRGTKDMVDAIKALSARQRRSINMTIVLLLEDGLARERLWPYPPGEQ